VTKLADWLKKACDESGLHAELGFSPPLPGGAEVSTVVALIQKVGAPNGMLVFRTSDDIEAFRSLLRDAGYGYSVLEEPWAGEQFDLNSFQDMFRDWGWSGSPESKPDWM